LIRHKTFVISVKTLSTAEKVSSSSASPEPPSDGGLVQLVLDRGVAAASRAESARDRASAMLHRAKLAKERAETAERRAGRIVMSMTQTGQHPRNGF
jgi:hypothetical protein